jgi:hypothetical protein
VDLSWWGFNMITAKALQQLGFESLVDFRLYDNSDGKGQQMEWLSDQPQPSESEIAVGQAAWDSKEYTRNRKAEYPSIDELTVSIWEAVVEERLASSIDVQSRRVAVKNKYPKDA